MKPIVVVAGIMDTKGKELLYIRDRVRVMGCDTLMIELSLGKEVKADWIDVHISDLLRGVDKTPSDIFAMTRGDAAKVVTEAAIKYITRLQKSGKMHALIAYCGGMGSSIVAPVMQTLPYGMPKILHSTMVHCAEQYLANKDVEMYRVDMHINQPEFADLFYLALHSILDGRYEKGSLANGKNVEKLF